MWGVPRSPQSKIMTTYQQIAFARHRQQVKFSTLQPMGRTIAPQCLPPPKPLHHKNIHFPFRISALHKRMSTVRCDQIINKHKNATFPQQNVRRLCPVICATLASRQHQQQPAAAFKLCSNMFSALVETKILFQ